MIKHIDLFSGIGGFAYAAQQVWGAEYENVFFCENNQFCQEVIKKNFGKDSVIYGDIREVTADAHYGRQAEQKQQATRDKQCDKWIVADTESGKPGESTEYEGRKNISGRDCEVDLLTGGFPCQPFSQAGKQRGTADNRYLWPEMFRVIKDFKPIWVIAENVRGLLTIEQGVVFEQVCADLEGEDYEVQSFIIPAVAVGAPHRRDRVWIVANSTSKRPNIGEHNRQERHIPDDKGIAAQSEPERNGRECGIGEVSSDAPDTKTKRLEKPGFEPREQASSSKFRDKFYDWETNWIKVATRLCGVDDGLPAELYFIGGLENDKVEGIKTESEVNAAIGKILRYMWEQKETSKTSQDLYKRGFYNLVPNLPPQPSHQKWNLGHRCEETTKLHNLWKRFYSEGFASPQNLQRNLLEQIRQTERTKKVGGYTKTGHRTERLQALGNAIVPQVAVEIMRAIKYAEEVI